MLLQEEYLKRHRFTLPEVRHTLTTGSLILKAVQAEPQDRWVLVNIHWIDGSQHPGYYNVKIIKPIHNGCNSKELFVNLSCYPPTFVLSYEEMEQFFLEFATYSHGTLHAIHDVKESNLAAWEIFLYCFDSFLASYASYKLKSCIENSIDFDLSTEDRHVAYFEAINVLMTEQSPVFDKYSSLIHTFAQNQLNWLATLVNAKF